MIHSSVRVGGKVPFPAHIGERVYMQKFFQQDGLPANLKRWQPTVDAMLKDIQTNDHSIYIMIDQGSIRSGETHRRGGIHVDGNWITGEYDHGPVYFNPTSQVEQGSQLSGGHRHCPPQPVEPRPTQEKKPTPYVGHNHRGESMHSHGFDYKPELLLLASDVSACRAITGVFDGLPQADGDCSHIDVSQGKEIIMKPDRVYAGNVSFLHESFPVVNDCDRTLVRLNIPGITLN